MTFHNLGVLSADHRYQPNHILSLTIRWISSVARSDWSIADSAGKPMHGRFVFTVWV